MNRPIVAIIAARNEHRCIANVLRQLRRAGVGAAVVVCNGSADDTLQQTLNHAHVLPDGVQVIWVRQALGHDVPRAMGTYRALRMCDDNVMFVYVDADWCGSFGPNLADFLAFGCEQNADVLSITWSSLDPNSIVAKTAAVWRRALAKQTYIPQNAAPFILPILTHARLFRQVSPRLLAHPGIWFAVLATRGCTWQTYEHWQVASVGQQTRSRLHHQQMALRIFADGLAAYHLLSGRRAAQAQSLPELPRRDWDALARYAQIAWITD